MLLLPAPPDPQRTPRLLSQHIEGRAEFMLRHFGMQRRGVERPRQPDRLLQPLRLAGTVDAMRVAMLRFTITQAQVDADDVSLTIGYALAAVPARSRRLLARTHG